MMMIGKRSAFDHRSASISDSTDVDHLGGISALRLNRLYSTAMFIRAWRREIPLRPHRCRLGSGGERQLSRISAAAMPQRQGELPARSYIPSASGARWSSFHAGSDLGPVQPFEQGLKLWAGKRNHTTARLRPDKASPFDAFMDQN